MDANVIVMIVTLALPNGQQSVSVKQMPTAEACRVEAEIEASDPFVSEVMCSELEDGKLEINFPNGADRKISKTTSERSTG
jgi:hypothetical protein